MSRILGKLLTRIWWIYHSSSPIMKPIYMFETDDFVDVDQIKNESSSNQSDSEDNDDYESDSDNDDNNSDNGN